jgi:hypothetical protein
VRAQQHRRSVSREAAQPPQCVPIGLLTLARFHFISFSHEQQQQSQQQTRQSNQSKR